MSISPEAKPPEEKKKFSFPKFQLPTFSFKDFRLKTQVGKSMFRHGYSDDERDRALTLLEQMVEQRTFYLPYGLSGPTWEPIRSDPRFKQVLRKLGVER